MKPLRPIAMLAACAAILSVPSCTAFRRGPSPAELRMMAVADTLRDSIARLNATVLAMDSLTTPLSLATPDSFLVAFETTRGRFEMMAHYGWAPVGVDRFYDLVRRRFYDDVTIFRVVKGFVAQFGISPDPAVSAAWRNRRIADDRVRESNTRGRVSFASGGANTRTTQVFINFANNVRLDSAAGGYPPIGEIVRGMEVVDSLYSDYGGRPSSAQGQIQARGNAFLRDSFPNLDVIRTARIIQEWRRPR